MATYVLLSNFTDQGIKGIKDSPKRLNAVKKLFKGLGIRMKDFYLTLGTYDVVVVIDAPDDATVARAALAIASAGNVRTTTLKAFGEAEYRKIIASL